jgi:hypothetical protein
MQTHSKMAGIVDFSAGIYGPIATFAGPQNVLSFTTTAAGDFGITQDVPCPATGCTVTIPGNSIAGTLLGTTSTCTVTDASTPASCPSMTCTQPNGDWTMDVLPQEGTTSCPPAYATKNIWFTNEVLSSFSPATVYDAANPPPPACPTGQSCMPPCPAPPVCPTGQTCQAATPMPACGTCATTPGAPQCLAADATCKAAGGKYCDHTRGTCQGTGQTCCSL